MNIHWVDSVNSDAQFLNLLSHSMIVGGNRVVVRSNKRDIFKVPEQVEWHDFSILGRLPKSLDGHPMRYAVGLAYPADWVRTVAWLVRNRVKSILLTGHLKLPPIDTAAHIALRRAGIETVHICHKPHPDYFEAHSPKIARKYKRYYHCSSKIITMTDYTRRLMMNYYDLPADKFIQMPHPHFAGLLSNVKANGASESRLKAWATDLPVITITSNYTPEHGFNQFFAALPYLRKQFKKIRLLIVSVVSDAIRKKIKHKLDAAGFLESEYQLLTSSYSYSDLLAMLEVTSLMLTPYNWATQSGVIPLASAFGKPVVATDVGGLKEMVLEGKSGEVVKADDPEQMAAACARILNSANYQHYLKGSFLACEELFSPKKATDIVVKTLSDLER